MIGDVLTSSILFEALRKEFPEAELHYMIYEHTSPVVQNNPNIDRFIIPDKNQSLKSMIANAKKEQYYAIIDVYSNLRTALITGLSRAKYRISYDKKYTRPLCTHVFSRKIEVQTSAGAAIEKRLRLLSPFSEAIPKEIKPKIYLTEDEIFLAKKRLKEADIDLSKNLYMIGALGSSAKKTYPLKYLAKLLDHIVMKTKANLLFNYIPSQRYQIEKLYQLCQLETQNKIHLEVYGKSLREFLALTSHCDALIGNEGGSVNMAKALDVPTFAIFSPPIRKENWNIYEDAKHNISVHLRDFNGNVFEGRSENSVKREWHHLYSMFKPELFLERLNHFLSINSK